ncbi:MAG: pseudouridine synthase [Chloroflexi bacterium]|nr:pseudouridine synthase [Chloroflexota bacterium]
MTDRLQKLMSQAGVASRRESETLIRDGRVRVNGNIAKIGDKADPAKDRIEVNGRLLSFSPSDKHLYIALNKPKGVLSSTEDELNQGRRTVRDLIDLPGHLYPVGRLDKQSEGLMLTTNDGQLAHRLTHPRFGHEKNVPGRSGRHSAARPD